MNETPTPRPDAEKYADPSGPERTRGCSQERVEEQLRIALDGHPDSELWGENGLIAAIMRDIRDARATLAAVTVERDEARDQLFRICKDGFDNQDTIGQEPADDYVLRQLNVLKMSLRFVEEERNVMTAKVSAMRAALNGAVRQLDKWQKFYGEHFADRDELPPAGDVAVMEDASKALSTPAPAMVPMADVEPLLEAMDCMEIGICACAIPHAGERATASLAISEARKAKQTFNTKHPKP